MSLSTVLSILCSSLVGAVFLLTGGIKALAPMALFQYFDELGVTNLTRLRAIAWVSAVTEGVLGTALLVRAFPGWLFPGTIVLLIAFAALTGWGARKVGDDCACYGKLLSLSPAKSIGLDGLYAALVIVAWRLPVHGLLPVSAQIAILAGSAVLFAAVTTLGQRFLVQHGKDWLDLNPLQVGRTWQADWLQGFAAVASGDSQLVVLMSPTCPHCKVWVKPLNKIARRVDMPQVIAGMAASDDEIRGVVAEHGIAFPVLRVKPSVMDRIAGGYPDVVLVEKGIVRAKPGARLPDDLVQRLKSSLKRPADDQPLPGPLVRAAGGQD